MIPKPFHLGIDLSQEQIVVALLDDTETCLHRQTFPNTPEGYQQLHAYCQPLNAPVIWWMEATGSLFVPLAHFAQAHGYEVYVLNPKAVHYLGKALLRSAKTDTSDAELIARCGRMRLQAGQARAWRPHAAELWLLREWLRQREDYKRMVLQQQERLRALELRGASEGECAPARRVLEALQEALGWVEHQVELWEEVHPEWRGVLERWRSVPGIGVWTALVLLAETGGLDRFSDGGALARYCGLVPMIWQSGKRSGLGCGLVSDGNRRLRSALYMSSLSAVRVCGVFQELYRRLLGRGKGKKVALCAVARHLVLVLYALWRDGRDYEVSYHRQAMGLEVRA